MTLRLLHYADLEAAYDVPERVGRLATAVRERRDERTVDEPGRIQDAMVAHAERAGIPTEPVDWFRGVGSA